MALEDEGPIVIGSAAERERWRGRVDTLLDTLQNFTKDINNNVTRTDEKLAGKLDATEKALNIKLDSSEKALNLKVESIKEKFDENIDKLDDKFSDLKNTVTKLVVICSTVVFLMSVVVPMAIKALLGIK